MKFTAIMCLLLLFTCQRCFTQPVSWFAGAGGGITQLSAKQFTGKQVTHDGNMTIAMAGVDIPLHENLRPIVRATLSAFRAYFHTTQIPAYAPNYTESYSIDLNSITTEISFLYHVVNHTLKLYCGAGVNVHNSWSTRNDYNLKNMRTGNVIMNLDNYLILEHDWLSFNLKTGVKYRRWELGATGYVKGIISEMNFEVLNANLYFLFIGYRINKMR
jgi:hypothetical protein